MRSCVHPVGSQGCTGSGGSGYPPLESGGEQWEYKSVPVLFGVGYADDAIAKPMEVAAELPLCTLVKFLPWSFPEEEGGDCRGSVAHVPYDVYPHLVINLYNPLQASPEDSRRPDSRYAIPAYVTFRELRLVSIRLGKVTWGELKELVQKYGLVKSPVK